MSFGYPDGLDGSYYGFCEDYEDIDRCGDCRWCRFLTSGGSDVGYACTVDAEGEGVVRQVDDVDYACERFQRD